VSDVEAVEALWAPPGGPLYVLRQGILTSEGVSGVSAVLRSIEIDSGSSQISRRLVSLLWYMPIFIDWQEGRFAERGGDIAVLRRFRAEVTNEIERILGTP